MPIATYEVTSVCKDCAEKLHNESRGSICPLKQEQHEVICSECGEKALGYSFAKLVGEPSLEPIGEYIRRMKHEKIY